MHEVPIPPPSRSRRSARSVTAALAALGAIALAVAFAPLARAGTGRAEADATAEAQAEQVGLDAYVYGIPLMEFLRTERTQTSVTVPDSSSDAPINELGNARELASPSNHVIVQPNNDTLYTMGHVDLSGGPLVLHVPAVPSHRYYSFEFIDPYTNVFAYVGTRTTGDGAGNFLIAGPSYRGRPPAGMRVIHSPYARAWLVGRTLVYGSSDLAEVHRIQDGYGLIPLAEFLAHSLSWRPPTPRHIVSTPSVFTEPTGVAFFDALGTALAENPPPARDAAELRELRTVGVGPGLQPSKEHLSAATLAGLTAAADSGAGYVGSLKTSIASKVVIANHGWFVPPANIGDYATDYELRAVVALAGLAANRPAEAMYIIGVTDSSYKDLNGANDYVIQFPAGQLPPARYFWSLTMYNAQYFLVANPLNRYEIGNRTPGLKRNPDGSLDIYIQHTAPPGHESNWLPSPAGTFEVTLRLYGPLPQALGGTYMYPPIVRTG